jgi:hypothetical protein
MLKTVFGAKFLMLFCLAAMTWHFRSQNKKLRDGKLSMLEGRVGFYYTL